MEKAFEDKYNELQVQNVSLQIELQNENNENSIITQRIASLEKESEDATSSAASSVFSRFTQQEFKELAIKTNQQHHELISELFQTLDNIFETHIIFGNMSVVLKNQV